MIGSPFRVIVQDGVDAYAAKFVSMDFAKAEQDIHQQTMTDLCVDRNTAKMINFGTLYGTTRRPDEYVARFEMKPIKRKKLSMKNVAKEIKNRFASLGKVIGSKYQQTDPIDEICVPGFGYFEASILIHPKGTNICALLNSERAARNQSDIRIAELERQIQQLDERILSQKKMVDAAKSVLEQIK